MIPGDGLRHRFGIAKPSLNSAGPRVPPRKQWSIDNTSRLISTQPLRDPDAAASYTAGISEYNLPRISLKILNP